jgi:hypothetical protein
MTSCCRLIPLGQCGLSGSSTPVSHLYALAAAIRGSPNAAAVNHGAQPASNHQWVADAVFREGVSRKRMPTGCHPRSRWEQVVELTKSDEVHSVQSTPRLAVHQQHSGTLPDEQEEVPMRTDNIIRIVQTVLIAAVAGFATSVVVAGHWGEKPVPPGSAIGVCRGSGLSHRASVRGTRSDITD